ncbi:MAG TPA: sterol desaturase family protein [Burkholderiales bacterium]|nr:sterol desaturase family protein [Burkholderiales bacterium]
MTFLLGLFSGVLVGSLAEYWVHRLQHWRVLKAADHADHHARNAPRSWLEEYWAYVRPGAVPVVLAAALWLPLSPWAAAGWVTGALGYGAYSAYVHELQHTDPSLAFWIERPVHYFHHKHDQREHNFAFATTVWDRLFGTFKDDPQWRRTKMPLAKIFSIKWF